MKSKASDAMTMAYHELRSPLGLMVTAARSVALQSPDECVRERCESIVRAAERMLRTATGILEIAAAAPPSDEESAFSPRAVVVDIVEDYRQLGLAIQVETSGPDGVTFASRERFESLICSLIGNAMDHGDPNAPIRVRVRMAPGGCEISLKNAVGGRHRGLGLGGPLASTLASEIGATLSTSGTPSEFEARVDLPLARIWGLTTQDDAGTPPGVEQDGLFPSYLRIATSA